MSEISVEELQQSNGERLQHLQLRGLTINTQALTLRHLIEVLFPEEEQRSELNYAFQVKLAEALTAAEAQADSATLSQTGPNGSGLYVPGN